MEYSKASDADQKRVRGPTKGLNIESNRVASFQGSRWNTFPVLFIYRLASAGFFSVGINDEVECFSCGARLSYWNSGESPKSRHKRANPSCRFVRGEDARNIADVDVPVDRQRSPLRPRHVENVQNRKPIPRHSDRDLGRRRDEVKPPSRPRDDDFSFERNRLKTFTEWPLSVSSDPYELSACGFHLVDGTGTVQCFACFVRVPFFDWKVGDRPMDKHRAMSPSCPFVLGKPNVNHPMTGADRLKALSRKVHQEARPSSTLKARFPEFTSDQSRVATFKKWNYSSIVDPVQLAGAGFFYLNRKDRVRCFCCGCVLEDWQFGDDPWEEHARWSPSCGWLKRKK